MNLQGRKIMKKLLLILLLVPSIGFTANSSSGNALLKQCTYAEALLDGKKIDAELGEDYAFLCLGYVSGVYETLFINNEVCGPNVANWHQARVVYDYLIEHTETLHFDRYVLTKIALKNEFPCKSNVTDYLSSSY